MNREEFLKHWRESGREEFVAQAAPQSLDDAQRTVDVIWFTGIDVPRYDWRSDEDYLRRFDPAGVDLSLLNNGAPVLDCHWMMGVSDQKGCVDKAWIEKNNYMGTLRFSRRTDVDGLWQDIKDKIVSKFSMGVEILDSTDLARKEGDPLVKLATKWRPFEISIAPLPADFGTTTLRAELPAKPQALSATADRRRRELEILRLR